MWGWAIARRHLNGRQIFVAIWAVILSPFWIPFWNLNVERWLEERGWDRLLVESEGGILSALGSLIDFLQSREFRVGMILVLLYAFSPFAWRALVWGYGAAGSGVATVRQYGRAPRFSTKARITLGRESIALADEMLRLLDERERQAPSDDRWRSSLANASEEEKTQRFLEDSNARSRHSDNLRRELRLRFTVRVKAAQHDLAELGYLDDHITFGWDTNPLSIRAAAAAIGSAGQRLLRDNGSLDGSVEPYRSHRDRP